MECLPPDSVVYRGLGGDGSLHCISTRNQKEVLVMHQGENPSTVTESLKSDVKN